MSNSLAIAATTAALRSSLQSALSQDRPGVVAGATVTTVRPGAPGNGVPDKGVNLYLYQIAPNPHWRNSDLPARHPDSTPARRPRAALDLIYLLSFYGDESQLEPQRLLGLVVSHLSAEPLISRAAIQAAKADPSFGFLAAADLDEEPELVRLTPVTLSSEEISKIWSVLLQVPYTLSLVYQGSVVIVEADLTPTAAPPVRARNIYAEPLRQPHIARVSAADDPDVPIVAGGSLILEGSRLSGDGARARIGEHEIIPAEVGDNRVRLTLPDDLPAGVHGVQMRYSFRMGTPPAPHQSFESNLAAFVLRPQIVAIGPFAGGAVTVRVSPPVGRRQQALLLLREDTDDNPTGRSLPAEPREGDTDSLRFALADVAPGRYQVRVLIDRAESPLNPAAHIVSLP